MSILTGKRVLVFDWDGTLFDSMSAKLRTFSETLAELAVVQLESNRTPMKPDEAIARIAEVYKRLSGVPRRRIFVAALADLGLGAEAIPFERFDAALRERNQRELLDAPLFPDAEAFLYELLPRTYQLYISSSVPQAELAFLTSRRLPGAILGRLTDVFGSDGEFSKGPGHIARILDETGAAKSELLFFGDDRADAELAQQAGIDCVLVDRHMRFVTPPAGAQRIPQFDGLRGELAHG